jgi:hypothetical protein
VPENAWSVDPNSEYAHGVHIVGTPDEISADDDFVDYIAGFSVESVSDGQHDGKPAKVFNLEGVGRMAVRDGEDIEWVREFGPSGIRKLANFMTQVEITHTKPKAVSTKVELYFNEWDDEELIVAEWSSDYGVTLWCVAQTPTYPTYELRGLRENVSKFLVERLQLDPADYI